MKLIVGLGNPDKKYEKNRHNAGFLFVDYLYETVTRHGQNITGNTLKPWKKSNKYNSEIAELNLAVQKFILAKPTTYMNNSGQAVQLLVTGYRLPVTDLIIIHDEIDLPLGIYKIQSDRGPAGHNGVKSIIERLGTKNFTRIRIGICPQEVDKQKPDTAKFVLKNFNRKEQAILRDKIFPDIVNKIIN